MFLTEMLKHGQMSWHVSLIHESCAVYVKIAVQVAIKLRILQVHKPVPGAVAQSGGHASQVSQEGEPRR